ncbi:MAG TPA: PHP domain-containing protein [Sedimentibacter sp.]|nr:PHP domain-containing protein [Sedimentibacter sp.]
MNKHSGLSFQKFDLHVHTPGSHDFVDKSVTPKQIVEKTIEKGLKGIAITDHNTGDWIDKVKKEANNTNLVVFPGVEIYCTGGKDGIHVIGILGPDKGTKHIEAILAKLKINPDEYGTKNAVSTLSPYQVIDVISECNGIGVLAHCTSSKGVLHDITGLTRTKIFENPALLAVEASYHDFIDPEKIKKHIRAIDLLDGKDENYNFRRLGVYIASDSKGENDDNHNLNAIGSKYTYFKVDDEIDLESLRQCFIDRDVRIRQYFEYKEDFYPYIKAIEVKGGFFDGQVATFHSGLNSILGAKGSGKSLLVELMRFVLGQPSSQKEILDDHKRKLEKKLETYGSVKIKFIDETGVENEIERTYNPSKNNPYNKEEQERIASSFKILFLSQNEIVKIAEDENEQIRFIDRFFDFQHYQNRVKNTEIDLSELDIQFAEGLRSVHILNDVRKQISKNNSELEKLNKLLSDPIYDNYKLLEQKDRALKVQESYLNTFREYIISQKLEAENLDIPSFKEPLVKDPAIMRNDDIIKKSKSYVIDLLNKAIEDIEKAIRSVQTEYKKWNIMYLGEKQKYEEHIRNAGGDRKALENQRLKVLKESEDLKKREEILVKKTSNLKNINKQRDNIIKQLFEIYNEYSNERKSKCEKFEKESNGRLQIKIYESTNIDEFKNKLCALKRGSYLRDTEIDELCSKVTPYDFILTVLRYEVSHELDRLKPLSKKIGIEVQRLQALCEFLLSQVSYEELLKLQYRVHPQDKPEIKFRLNEQKYELIRDISVGQKCTAMLIMALSDGNFTIVIDQPEDSLDVRSVWDDMCTKIRKGKEKRQFILTTHNSCLAVASDTDKYTIVESDAISGSIVISGALESDPVKEEVIKYLEGGRPTYHKKASKYGMKGYFA